MQGFTKEQIETGWLSPTLGNTYSGASPMGLTAILDIAKPGDWIMMVSYGSGAGSDGFVWKVTDRINEVRDKAPEDPGHARFRSQEVSRLRHLCQVSRAR